jgi:hypothetical protein
MESDTDLEEPLWKKPMLETVDLGSKPKKQQARHQQILVQKITSTQTNTKPL